MKMTEKLIVLRKNKGLTQLKLAEVLDVSRQAVSKWEVGEAVPSIENLKSLCDLYEIPLEYLINDELEDIDQCRKPKEKSQKNRRKICIFVLSCLLGLIVVVVLIYRETGWKNSKANVGFSELESEQIENRDIDNGDIKFSLRWGD